MAKLMCGLSCLFAFASSEGLWLLKKVKRLIGFQLTWDTFLNLWGGKTKDLLMVLSLAMKDSQETWWIFFLLCNFLRSRVLRKVMYIMPRQLQGFDNCLWIKRYTGKISFCKFSFQLQNFKSLYISPIKV